jgi:hypothetical protein
MIESGATLSLRHILAIINWFGDCANQIAHQSPRAAASMRLRVTRQIPLGDDTLDLATVVDCWKTSDLMFRHQASAGIKIIIVPARDYIMTHEIAYP